MKCLSYRINYEPEFNNPYYLPLVNPYLKSLFNTTGIHYKSTYYKKIGRIVANVDTKWSETFFGLDFYVQLISSRNNELFQSVMHGILLKFIIQ